MQQYSIEPNDTLYDLANRFKIPLGQLIKANPQIDNPNILYLGQIITIPDMLPIPRQLLDLESNTRTIIDEIYTGDWDRATRRVSAIKANLIESTPFLQEAVIPNRLISGINLAINNLEQNVAQKKTYQAISQANQITQYIPDLYDYFKVSVPTNVGRLYYLARQILINVEQNDWNEANNNYLRINKIWEELKPSLNPDRYSKDISEFDQILNNISESIKQQNYASTIDIANQMLTKIERIETDFRQQGIIGQ